MATYTLDATVHETLDIPLREVRLGRYDGNTKEADLTPVYVDGGYNARNYTATDTLADATGRKWRWTATDIYGSTGSATVPRDRIQVWADIVTCEDARVKWQIDGSSVNGTLTVSHNGTTVKTFSVTANEGTYYADGGLEPLTTYDVTLTATVDGTSLSGSNTFTTEAFVPNYLCITNKSTGSDTTLVVQGALMGNCTVKLEYSFDGENWSNWDDAYISIRLNYGRTLYLRGYGGTLSTSLNDYFVLGWTPGTGKMAELSGDANFLLSRKGGMIRVPDYAFYRLYYTVTCFDVNNLTFGGKIAGSASYADTFRNSSVTHCPTFAVIDGPDVSGAAFSQTFKGSSLTTFDPFTGHPEHIGLSSTCEDCTSLTTAVIRMAKADTSALDKSFKNCTALASVTFHVPQVWYYSCDHTFEGCTSLTSITSAADTLDWAGGTTYFRDAWLLNASTTGTFHKPQSVSFAQAALPEGWTISNDVTA